MKHSQFQCMSIQLMLQSRNPSISLQMTKLYLMHLSNEGRQFVTESKNYMYKETVSETIVIDTLTSRREKFAFNEHEHQKQSHKLAFSFRLIFILCAPV